MEHLNINISALFVIILLNSCASNSSVSPSQNNQLSNITNHNKTEKNGYIQNSLDSWLKNDWEPTVKEQEVSSKELKKESANVVHKDEKIIKKEKTLTNESETFTLQKYVDKASLYMKAHPTDGSKTHYKRLESLPVIGK